MNFFPKMLQRIKDLMKTKEEIDNINKKLEENIKVISDLRLDLDVLKKELGEVNINQKEFLKSFKETFFIVKNIREDLGKEIYEFKLLKAQMQRKILEKFEEELRKDLDINRAALMKDADDYNELKRKLNEILPKLNLTGEEINKFIEISRNIKKEDFELTKFARHLLEMDKEKLELMRKIDTLERLVSKIRRKELMS